MTVREVMRILHNDGWQEAEARTKGSHRQFKQPTKPGKVTIPDHKGDIAPGTLNSEHITVFSNRQDINKPS